MAFETYFDTKQAAQDYPVSASYLTKLRLTGDGPDYFKVGRRVFYCRSAFETWLATRRRTSTSDAGRG